MDVEELENYWICVTNEENWDVIKNLNIWGVPERYKKRIESVKRGDLMVVYVMPKRIGGIFKATSNSFESRKAIFSWGEFGREELFPCRVKLEPVVLPKELIPFDQLIPKLTFIANKKRWTGHLRRAMRLIPKEDYETIKAALTRT